MVIFQIILTALPLIQEKVATGKKSFKKGSYDDEYFSKLK